MTATLCPTGRTLDQCIEQMTLMKAAPALLASAIVARDALWLERVSLADCHTGPDGLDEDGAAGVAEFDSIIGQLDAAIAAAEGRA